MGKVVKVSGIKLLSTSIEGADGKTLRTLMDNLKEKIGSGVIVLGSSGVDKVSLVGGKGGGRLDMAQAGGKDVSKLGEALGAVKGLIEKAG